MRPGLKQLTILMAAFLSSCCTFSGPHYSGPPSDHFDGEEFCNLEGKEKTPYKDLLKWGLNRTPGPWRDWLDAEVGPPPPRRVGPGRLTVTLVNHSTVLLQADEVNLLTDPVWSERVGPVTWAGPKRARPPGLRFGDLPPIDAVLVSHNHYDHLNLPTLKRLKQVHNPLFVVPLGNKALLQKNGIDNCVALDWWQQVTVQDRMTVTLVPARHFSGRGLCDRNRTLWGGYVIQSSGGPVYFAGDTGFGVHFQRIREKYGPLRLSILPIGAYKPEWFMALMHISPADAVNAHKVLASQRSIGVHFGTFRLGDDGQFEPVRDLKRALHRARVPPEEFLVPLHGQGLEIPPLQRDEPAT